MSRRETPAVTEAVALRDCGIESYAGTSGALDGWADSLRLLRDITDIFHQWNADRIRTSVLIDNLSTMGGRRWTGMLSDYLCDAQNLARWLRPAFIRPKTIRFMDGTAKGYERRGFEDALVIYAVSASGGARSRE